MGNELIESKTLKKILEASKTSIAKALPKHLDAEKMINIALTEARKTPKLYKCDPISFAGAIVQASQLGLYPGSALGQCFLIPYENKKKGITEVNFQLGYKGMLDLAQRAGAHTYPRAVYEGDEFYYEYGLNEVCRHVPKHGNSSSKLVNVYAVITLADGRKTFEVMDMDEIEAVKAHSQSARYDDSPWKKHFTAMCLKSAVRKAFKYTPISLEMTKAITLDEQEDAGLSQDNADVFETTGRELRDEEELDKLLSAAPPEGKGKLKVKVEPDPAPTLPDADPTSFNNFNT